MPTRESDLAALESAAAALVTASNDYSDAVHAVIRDPVVTAVALRRLGEAQRRHREAMAAVELACELTCELAAPVPTIIPLGELRLVPAPCWQLPPLAPRPFSQLARRMHRLGLVVPRGLWPALNGAAWYRRRLRRPAVAAARPVLRAASRRRRSRAYWERRPLYLVSGRPLGLAPDPFIVYGSCEVA